VRLKFVLKILVVVVFKSQKPYLSFKLSIFLPFTFCYP